MVFRVSKNTHGFIWGNRHFEKTNRLIDWSLVVKGQKGSLQPKVVFLFLTVELKWDYLICYDFFLGKKVKNFGQD